MDSGASKPMASAPSLRWGRTTERDEAQPQKRASGGHVFFFTGIFRRNLLVAPPAKNGNICLSSSVFIIWSNREVKERKRGKKSAEGCYHGKARFPCFSKKCVICSSVENLRSLTGCKLSHWKLGSCLTDGA